MSYAELLRRRPPRSRQQLFEDDVRRKTRRPVAWRAGSLALPDEEDEMPSESSHTTTPEEVPETLVPRPCTFDQCFGCSNYEGDGTELCSICGHGPAWHVKGAVTNIYSEGARNAKEKEEEDAIEEEVRQWEQKAAQHRWADDPEVDGLLEEIAELRRMLGHEKLVTKRLVSDMADRQAEDEEEARAQIRALQAEVAAFSKEQETQVGGALDAAKGRRERLERELRDMREDIARVQSQIDDSYALSEQMVRVRQQLLANQARLEDENYHLRQEVATITHPTVSSEIKRLEGELEKALVARATVEGRLDVLHQARQLYGDFAGPSDNDMDAGRSGSEGALSRNDSAAMGSSSSRAAMGRPNGNAAMGRSNSNATMGRSNSNAAMARSNSSAAMGRSSSTAALPNSSSGAAGGDGGGDLAVDDGQAAGVGHLDDRASVPPSGGRTTEGESASPSPSPEPAAANPYYNPNLYR